MTERAGEFDLDDYSCGTCGDDALIIEVGKDGHFQLRCRQSHYMVPVPGQKIVIHPG